jgi:N-acetylglucosamine-6-phosphate deacetylase
VRCASANPANAIGAPAYGRLAPGARADLLAIDPSTLAVRGVWIGGEAVAPG